MKICLINNLYPPYNRGGAEQVVVKIAQGLVKQNHEVFVITSDPYQNKIEFIDGIKVYRLKFINLYFYTNGHIHNFIIRVFWHILDIFNIFIAQQVKNILIKEKPDIVHTHNLMGLSFLIPKIIRKLNIRHIHTVHDVQLAEPSGLIIKSKENTWRYNNIFNKIYIYVMKKLMASPNVVISPSQFLLDFYRKHGFFKKSKFVILRNPLTFSRFKVNKKRNTKINFLYVGQIEEHKGILLLIKTFLNLEHLADKFVLHVVGSGSQLEKIKKMSLNKKYIRIYGRQERDFLVNFFQQADLTIVPSLCYENSPTVIFESFIFQTPVLATNIEGIAELIRENENGLTFSLNKKNDLLNKITAIINGQIDIYQMRLKTNQMVSNYSLNKYINLLLSFYKQDDKV